MTDVRWEAIEDAIAVNRPMRFEGSDSEIARNFFLAWVLLRERAQAGGIKGIDYEQLAQPSAPTPGRGFGGWLEGAYAYIAEFEQIALETVRNVDPDKVKAWVRMRHPDSQKSSRAVAKELGGDRSDRSIRLDAQFLDRCLVGALRRRDYVIRG